MPQAPYVTLEGHQRARGCQRTDSRWVPRVLSQVTMCLLKGRSPRVPPRGCPEQSCLSPECFRAGRPQGSHCRLLGRARFQAPGAGGRGSHRARATAPRGVSDLVDFKPCEGYTQF